MKKTAPVLLAALLALSLFAGCGRKKEVMPTTEPTQSLATVPSENSWEPQPTIEDGNGPIPSQSETMASLPEPTEGTISETVTPETTEK